MAIRGLAVLAGVAALVGGSLQAQARPEFRGDVIVSDRTAMYAGAGVLFPVGTYLRSGIIGAVGVTEGSATFRGDLVTIFHADPFRESRWGLYGGGGVSFRHDSDISRTNAFLLGTLGIEGPPKSGFATAVEIGLGGGARAAIVLRQAKGQKR